MSPIVDANGAIHSGRTGRFTGAVQAEASTALLDPPAVATHELAPALAAMTRAMPGRATVFDSLPSTTMLDDGHAYCTDVFAAMRVRTPLAAGAYQTLVPLAELARALQADATAQCRIDAGGTVRIGAKPILPVPAGTEADALHHLPAMFDRFTATAEPSLMRLTDLTRLGRDAAKGDCQLDGWSFSGQRLVRAASALRALGARECTVERTESTRRVRDGRAIKVATLRLSAAGVEILLQSKMIPAQA